jgi:hypothetical protein
MTQAIITKEEFLKSMTSNQLITRLTEILSELLKISEYEKAAITKKEFKNINVNQEYTRNLLKEAEELEKIIVCRTNLAEEVSDSKKEKLKKLHSKLSEISEHNRIETMKIISINKIAIEAISSAVAHKKKFEYGYDHLGKFAHDSVIKKNTQPLNLNEKC